MNFKASVPVRFPIMHPQCRVAIRLCPLMITLLLGACQTDSATPLPVVITDTPHPVIEVQTTDTPGAVEATMGGVYAAPTVVIEIQTLNMTPTGGARPSPTNLIELAASITPTVTAVQEGVEIIGYSGEGRSLSAQRIGTGDRILLLVGGIHGGWEANTVELIDLLIEHYTANPSDVRVGVSLILIRLANPDGLWRGEGILQSRFNGNDVDLNRNWGCRWSADAVWRDQPVSAGERALSEPETQALASYILRIRPATALFYHSAAGGVFEGDCEGQQNSRAMATIYGEASGYSYGQAFSAYPVTGTAAAWVDGLGIPSADIELFTHDDPEFDRNLRAINAVQDWLIMLP